MNQNTSHNSESSVGNPMEKKGYLNNPVSLDIIILVVLLLLIGFNVVVCLWKPTYASLGVGQQLESIRTEYRQLARMEKELIDLDTDYSRLMIQSIDESSKSGSQKEAVTDSLKRQLQVSRAGALRQANAVQCRIDSLLLRYEEASNAVMEAKVDEIDRNVTLWVSILCGVATIVALTCSISQIISYKDIKEEIKQIKSDAEDTINEEKREVEDNIKDVQTKVAHDIDTNLGKTHALKATQLLMSVNSLRSFNRKDSFIYEDHDCIRLLLDQAITKIEESFKQAMPETGEDFRKDLMDQRELLVLLLNQISCFIDEYSPYFKSPAILKNWNKMKQELYGDRQELCKMQIPKASMERAEPRKELEEFHGQLMRTKDYLVEVLRDLKRDLISLTQ